MRPTAVRRSITAVAGFLLLTLSACSVPGFGPDAEDAVDQLAKGLSSGDVSSVDFAEGDAAATKDYGPSPTRWARRMSPWAPCRRMVTARPAS